MKTVEILLYTLGLDTNHKFHQITQDVSVPLHRGVGIDVVAYGYSLHDADSYYLIRAYDALTISQDKSHHSDTRINVQQEEVVNLIMTTTHFVITLCNKEVDRQRIKEPN